MTTKVVKGTLWTLIGVLVPIAVSLFTTPIVTRLLGAESYGLFVLILLIPTYLGFADFGMNVASTKFASTAYAEGSHEREARIVRTSALIVLVSSLPLTAVMIIFSRPIVGLFNVPEYLVNEAAFALKIAGIIFVVNFLGNVFNTPELTRLRMDINVWIIYGARILGLIFTPIVVYLGGGITGAVVVALCTALLTLTGHLVASVRMLPELIGFSIDRASVRPMVRFGGSLVIAGVAGVLLVNLEKFILTQATSVETLAYYSIAASFAGMLGVFSGSMAQSLFPAFSQLQGEENRPALNALYSRGLRLTLVFLIPAVVIMVLAARPFFTYWFSAEFGRESTGPFYVIAVGVFFNVLAYFPYSVVMASGRSDIFAKIYWAELIPYIFLVWWLASRFGAAGAAAAWSVRVMFDAVILFWLARRISRVSYHHRTMPQFTAALLIMTLPVAALIYYNELNPAVGVIALISTTAYAAIVLNKVIEKEEIVWLKNKIAVYLNR